MNPCPTFALSVSLAVDRSLPPFPFHSRSRSLSLSFPPTLLSLPPLSPPFPSLPLPLLPCPCLLGFTPAPFENREQSSMLIWCIPTKLMCLVIKTNHQGLCQLTCPSSPQSPSLSRIRQPRHLVNAVVSFGLISLLLQVNYLPLLSPSAWHLALLPC